MTTTDTGPIDQARLEAFVGQAVTDLGAAISGLLLHIGDRLGLYKAMAGAGPITSATLAARTGTAERYVREWLGNQAAGGYVSYNPADGTFERSTFAGFDIHEPSIVAARKAAAEAGVDQRARFDVATAKELPGTGYDLACMFDCLHDMGDPVGAARRIRQALAPDGTLLLVEPQAGEGLEDNLNPVGRTFYGLSTVICTPASLACAVDAAGGILMPGDDGRLGPQRRVPRPPHPVVPAPELLRRRAQLLNGTAKTETRRSTA